MKPKFLFYLLSPLLSPFPHHWRIFLNNLMMGVFPILHWMSVQTMVEVVAGIQTPPLQLTITDQGMYVTKTHFTLQFIIFLTMFCLYIIYNYGVFHLYDKSPKWEKWNFYVLFSFSLIYRYKILNFYKCVVWLVRTHSLSLVCVCVCVFVSKKKGL